jgi:Lrp/AsnC family leucine-responsive transcriptional regulator
VDDVEVGGTNRRLVRELHAATVAGLEDVLDFFLVHGQTVPSIVVTSPVPGRPLPIAD